MRSPSASRSITPRSERPIRRWISTVRPSGRPAGDVALLALAGRGGQHPVLRRHPAAALAGHPARHALLRGGGADHARLAHRDQRRARRGAHEARLDLGRTQRAPRRGRSCGWSAPAHAAPSFQSATVGGSCARSSSRTCRRTPRTPSAGSFVRDQVAALRRLDGLDVELYEFAPGAARARGAAARELRPALPPRGALRRRARALRADRLARAGGAARAYAR